MTRYARVADASHAVRHGQARRWLFLGAAALLVACSASTDERLARVERDARQRIAEAQRDADRKIAEAEQRLAALKAELAQKTAELERARREEASSFEADRKTFEQQCRATFERLDQDARTIAGKVGSGVESALAGIAEQRGAVERDLAALGVATRETYSDVKQRLNQDLRSFERSIDAARQAPRKQEPRR